MMIMMIMYMYYLDLYLYDVQKQQNHLKQIKDQHYMVGPYQL